MPTKNKRHYEPSDSIKRSISKWEGIAMDGPSIDPLSGKLVKQNNSFEEEARLFESKIPEELRDTILSNQSLADNLYSYSYNVGSGKFEKRVVPALKHFYNNPLSTAEEVTDSMYADGDKKLRGLNKRRETEKDGVKKNLPYRKSLEIPPHIEQPDATRVDRLGYQPSYKYTPKPMNPIKKNFWTEWGKMPYKAEGGALETSKTWDNLSMTEKSEMMRVAIENGITTLPEIREAYNKFAKGGNLYSGTENHSSQMHQGYVYDVLPKMLKEAGLNVRVTSGYRKPGQAGKAGSRSWHTHHGAVDIVPQGKTTFEDIERALYENPTISRYMIDNGFGLIDESGRTAESRATMKKTGATGAHFHIGKDSKAVSAYNNKMSSIWDSNMSQLETAINQPTLPVFMPSNPQAFFAPLESYQRPIVVEEPLVQAAMENPYSSEQLEREERRRGLNNLSFLLGMTSPQSSDNSFASIIGMLANNQLAEGGNLYSGEDEPTQQMNNDLNLYRRTNNLGETEYIYQETPDSEEILLTPTNKRFSDDPTNWDYKDASGREYSPRMITTYNPGELREDTRGPLERMVDNYFGELKYQVNNNVPISGKYTMPAIAAAPFLTWAGEAAYPYVSTALTNPYVDAGLTSAFAGHGLNHAINEGIDSWGDATMTALELVPLGRVVKPLYNTIKPVSNFVPTLDSNLAGVRYAYSRNPELANIGTLEEYNDYIKTIFPESRVRDINYHMGPKGLQELRPSTGDFFNTNPKARGIYVTPDKSYAESLRRYTTDRLEKPSAWTYLRRQLTPGGWDKANEAFTDIYPVMIDVKNPLHTKGSWTWGIGDKKYKSLMDNYDAIINSGPKWYENFHSMPESIVPKTEQSLILGSDADVAGFRRFMSNPQITAESAAGDTALGAADFSYKPQNGLDLLTKHLYERKIHGYPSSYTDAMEFVNREFVPVEKKWADDVSIGLPKYVQDAIMHDVVDRNIAEFIGEGLSAEEAAEYANAAKKQLGSVRVGKYSKRDYEKAGWGNFGGFYDPNRNFISINDAGNPRRVYTHEGRHLLDNKIDDEILSLSDVSVFGKDFDSDKALLRMQRARQKQEMTLRDAYDSDFESIPNSKFAEGLEDYKSMNREAITTNLDSRTYAYENFADARSLDSGVRIEDLPTAEQNAFIDGLTDEQIFEAVEGANGYGRRYIAVLRDKGKLTPEKAQQFRESMKHVGAYAVPTTIAAGTLYEKRE